MNRRSMLRISLRIIGFLVIYELAFRFCTYEWGEVNTDTRPISLYYLLDMMVPGEPLRWIFYPRTKLPLGRVRLSDGTGVYFCGGIRGGRFYRINSRGEWKDVSKAFEERDKRSLSTDGVQSNGIREKVSW